MMTWIKEWGGALVDMLWPNVCKVCGQTLVAGEHTLCLGCKLDMPVTNTHRHADNTIHRRIAATHPRIFKAAAYFHYSPGTPYAQLLVDAKYRRQPSIDRDLAHSHAAMLRNEHWFDGIDAVIPVPMHPWKKMRRGYNQAEVIAREVGLVADLPVLDNLRCTRRHGSQTHLGRLERWLNASDVYTVEYPDELDNLHLLIVDDIITTGSTILSCCQAVHRANPSVKLSVLSLGLTTQR